MVRGHTNLVGASVVCKHRWDREVIIKSVIVVVVLHDVCYEGCVVLVVIDRFA